MQGQIRRNRSIKHASGLDLGARVIRLAGIAPIRAGETLAGFKSNSRFISHRAYSVLAPAPIVFSTFYLVHEARLDDEVKKVWTDDAYQLQAPHWSRRAFREVYNAHYSDPDFYLDDDAAVTHANLREMIQTMDIVDSEQIQFTWDDWIELQTGRRPVHKGLETLSMAWGKMFRRRGHFHDTGALMQEVNHFEKMLTNRRRGNVVVPEYGFLVQVTGCWGHPLADESVGDANIEHFDTDLLITRDAWLPRLDQEGDTLGTIVAGSDKASINLFEGGDMHLNITPPTGGAWTIDYLESEEEDLDPTYALDSGAKATEASDLAASYGATTDRSDMSYPIRNYNYFGASILTDIGLF